MPAGKSPATFQEDNSVRVNSPEENSQSRLAERVGLPALLGLAVLLLYGRCFFYGYTNWDDGIYIVNNPAIQSFSLANLKRVFTPGGIPREMLYIPLTYLSFMLEILFFGLNPKVMHVTNVLLHLANALLVFYWLRRLCPKPVYAFLGALAFAVHPLQVEAGVWLMGRKDLLSTCFALLSLLAYQRYLDEEEKSWLHAALAGFVLAVLAKPSFIILPFLLVLLDFRAKKSWRALEWGNKIPFILVMVFAWFLHVWMPDRPDAGSTGMLFRALCVPWLAWHWVTRFLLFSAPVPIYFRPPGTAWLFLALTGLPAFALFLTVLILAIRRRVEWLWFGLSFFAIAFLPAAKIALESRDFLTADRYGYFPLIGIFGVLAMIPALLAGPARKICLIAWCLWLGLLCIFAVPAINVWSTSEKVWNRVLAEYPKATLAWVNRANTYAAAGKPEAALADYRRALKLAPADTGLRYNLGSFYLEQGQHVKAIIQFKYALEFSPQYCKAWLRLGDAYAELQKWSEAVKSYRTAWLLLPQDTWLKRPLRRRIKLSLRRALEHQCHELLRKNPRDVEALINLALIYTATRHWHKAAPPLQKALEIGSEFDADAYFYLGRVYLGQGKRDDAINAFREALRLQPAHPGAKAALEKLSQQPEIMP